MCACTVDDRWGLINLQRVDSGTVGESQERCGLGKEKRREKEGGESGLREKECLFAFA